MDQGPLRERLLLLRLYACGATRRWGRMARLVFECRSCRVSKEIYLQLCDADGAARCSAWIRREIPIMPGEIADVGAGCHESRPDRVAANRDAFGLAPCRPRR
jgi:hypothetical protein